MWRLVLSVVLWNAISSQPVTDDSDGTRSPRQLDFIECCPCPGSSRAGVQDVAAAPSVVSFSRAAPVDDCPCRLRDPDAQGSPSVFLPRTVRPVRPFMTPDEAKEDVKPLLKPEVGLASSMLETLREVTDEEYRDALARDAARNAARVSELGDAQPQTAKNVVTIIVNPREDDARDAIPEASQPFETRCAPNPNLGQVRDAQRSPDFKIRPKLLSRNLLDMDSGASDVKQTVVDLNKGLEGLRLKTTPSVLKLFPAKKPEGGNIQSLLKLKNTNIPKNAGDVQKRLDGVLKPKLPSLKLHQLFRSNEDPKPLKPLGLGFNKLNISTLRTSLARKQNENEDSNPSSSINREQISDLKGNNTPKFDLKSLLSTQNLNNNPLSLKNLLNLKDVELIPPKSTNLNLPGLKLLPPLRVNKPGTSFVKQRKTSSGTKNCKKGAKGEHVHTEILDALPHASEINPVFATTEIETTTTGLDKINPKAKDKLIKTQILDALPSASEHDVTITEKDNTNLDNSKEKDIRTQILDTLPSASEHNSIENLNSDNIETSTPVLSEDTKLNVNSKPENNALDSVNENIKDVPLHANDEEPDLEPQQFEENANESIKKLSKDDVGNVSNSPNSLEVTIDDDENIPFEEFEIDEESDDPFSEIEVSGAALDEDGEALDLEVDEEDPNPAESDFTNNTDENEFNGNEDVNPDFNELGLESEQETDDGTETTDVFFRDGSLDAVPETSNQNVQISSFEDIEPSNVLQEDSLLIGESSKDHENVSTKAQKQDVIPSIKERITLKLKTLKNPDSKVLTISKFSKPKLINKNIKEDGRSSIKSDAFTNKEPLSEDTDKFLAGEKSAETTESDIIQVDMQDIQEMSDSLLRKSKENRMSEIHSSETADDYFSSINNARVEEKEVSLDEGNEKRVNGVDESDMDSSATTLQETLAAQENLRENDDINSDIRHDSTDVNINHLSDETCLSYLQVAKSESGDETNKFAVNTPKTSENEMESGASETVFSTAPQFKSSQGIPHLPLLQQSIILQPTSLLPPLPPLDLTNLLTLDDLRSRISSIIEGNARAAGDEQVSSSDVNTAEDCSDTDPLMSTDASTTNRKTAFPHLRPLEDINLDIFQINPLQGSPLNLNSFRTKLALPKSLDLKPMKLQSTLGGKNGGLLGASLTFGPENTGSSRKTKPVVARLGSILNRQGSDILGNPLASIPSLEDLRSTMRANAQSLLRSSPLVKDIHSPLEDTLKTTQAFGNSLQSHAENTMRNLQQSLSSTLSEARVGGRNNAGEKFAKPENLLEMVSSAHEDMNDKLYAIHVDLQDRLSSIHERIKDETKLPIPVLPIQSPLLSGLGRLQDSPSSSIRGRSGKTSQTNSRTPSPKLIVRKRKPTAKLSKPTSQTTEQNRVKPFKISKAASSLTPKTVEVPKLMVTSSKPPFMRPLQRSENVKLKETRPIFETEQRQSPNRKPFKPFGVQTKVTISTMPPPVSFRTRPSTPRPQQTKSPFHEQTTRLRTNQKPFGQFRSLSDSRGYASEPQPSRVPAPVRSTSLDFSTINSEEGNKSPEVLRSTSLSSPSHSLPQFTLGNPLKSRHFSKSLNTPIKLPASKVSPAPLTLPKPTESPIVSKMREAIRIRFTRPKQQTEKLSKGTVGKPYIEDMSKSASENKDVMISSEPLKENVSYKCKMVCVRE